MPVKIYVVRHGEAVEKHVDPKRPLSERGRSEIREVAAFLEEAGVRVDRVVHSGKARAAETAEILGASVLPDGSPEAADGLSPNDPVDDVVERMVRRSQDSMMVGHLPFVGKFVEALTRGGPERKSASFDAGTVVCLERTEGQGWAISWSVGPRQVGG
jgi:phosphohistidine phosphatase